MKPRILVVEDDEVMRRWLALGLREEGLEVELYSDGATLLASADLERAHVLLLDLMLPGLPGLEVLQRVRSGWPGLSVIVLTAAESVQSAVDCMRHGATDYLQKPLDVLRLTTAVRNACEQVLLRERVRAAAARAREEHGLAHILGESEALRRAVTLLRRASASDVPVHFHGEPGTGKRLFARVLHAESATGHGPFVALRCGPSVEGELFGVPGATHESAQGALQRARGGTLFLDDVTALPDVLQLRLARLLVERPVGGVRIVLSSAADPEVGVRSGALHEELHRLGSTFSVRLPPLRERGDDVLQLAQVFLARAAEVQGRSTPELDEDARHALSHWGWPGNVRELDACMRRALLLGEGTRIGLQHLSDEIVLASTPVRATGLQAAGEPRIRTLEQVEKQAVLDALRLTGWNIQLAAERLCIARATLYRRLHAWGLTRPQAATAPEPSVSTPARPRLF